MDRKRVFESPGKLFNISFFSGILAGFGGIFSYSLNSCPTDVSVVSLLLLAALASLISGFFIGTLFGMPRRNNLEDNDYSLNNSLVEISDWLTKIIVGLGLVHLKQLPNYLSDLGEYISQSSGINPSFLNVISVGVVIYFFVFGLLFGYNGIRLILSPLYKEADDMILQKLKVKQEQVKSLLNIVNSSERDLETVEFLDMGAEAIDQTAIIDKLKTKAQEKLIKGQSSHSDDPQKGQWGGKSENNNRRILAEVKERFTGIYEITLKVLSTDQQNHPLNDGDWVLFALHPTFGNPPIRVVKVVNQTADINLLSYGSFTVGAFVNMGETELELDLADLPYVSEHFRNT